MPRSKHITPGGMVYHVLNRGVGRRTLFETDDDYRAFLRVVGHALRWTPIRICGYCLMPNHWHFLLWPAGDDDLPRFMQRLTNTHVQRWQ
jgi:putative transposase